MVRSDAPGARRPMAATGQVHCAPWEARTRTGQSSSTEAARKVPLRCRVKGQCRNVILRQQNQGRACRVYLLQQAAYRAQLTAICCSTRDSLPAHVSY